MIENAFKNLKRWFALREAIFLNQNLTKEQVRDLVDSQEAYKSRGKGRGTPSRRFGHKHQSKYMPHQGAQEIARRLRQQAK